MTHAEWEVICRIDTAVARVEQRLTDHVKSEERSWARRQGVAPWLSLLVAACAVAVSLVALVGR